MNSEEMRRVGYLSSTGSSTLQKVNALTHFWKSTPLWCHKRPWYEVSNLFCKQTAIMCCYVELWSAVWVRLIHVSMFVGRSTAVWREINTHTHTGASLNGNNTAPLKLLHLKVAVGAGAGQEPPAWGAEVASNNEELKLFSFSGVTRRSLSHEPIASLHLGGLTH